MKRRLEARGIAFRVEDGHLIATPGRIVRSDPLIARAIKAHRDDLILLCGGEPVEMFDAAEAHLLKDAAYLRARGAPVWDAAWIARVDALFRAVEVEDMAALRRAAGAVEDALRVERGGVAA